MAAAAAWNPSIVQTGRDGAAHSWDTPRASEFADLYIYRCILYRVSLLIAYS